MTNLVYLFTVCSGASWVRILRWMRLLCRVRHCERENTAVKFPAEIRPAGKKFDVDVSGTERHTHTNVHTAVIGSRSPL